MEALEERQYQKGTRYLQDVQEQYRKAINEAVQDIEHWYRRLADNNNISLAAARKLLKKDELDEFQWSVEQYIKAGRENAVNQRWMKELENASAKYHISYLQAMKLQMQQHAELLAAEFEGGMTEFLYKSYGDQYYRTAFEIAKGTGVGSNLTQLDKRKVEVLLKKPWAQDEKNFSDRIWDNKEKLVRELHKELAQNIIRGESPDKAIERLAKTMNVSRNQAGTLVMTELSAISSEAQRECFKELGVREFLVVETLDGITCETCQAMDRKHFPLSDFVIGETAPPFHPHCRGCVSPYYDDEFSQTGERAARDPETGETCYVPADMAYPEWKEKYVKDPVAGKNSGRYNDKKMKISFPDDISRIKGITPQIREELDAALAKLNKEYEIKLHSLTVEPAGKGDIFIVGWYAGKMGMVVNRDMDFEKVRKLMVRRHETGEFAGKTFEDYMAHEMFHVMLYQDCETEQQYRAKYEQIEGLYENLRGISKYADRVKSGNEALAEAFVRMRNGEEVPQIAKVLVEVYIRRWKK